MNKISKQLIKIASGLEVQNVVEKQKQIFQQYGFDFKKNENGYVAEKTTKFMNYKFTLDLSRANSVKLYPNIVYTQQTDVEFNAFVPLTRMSSVTSYQKLTQLCINPLEDEKQQIEWFQSLCKELSLLNEQ